MSTGTHSEYVCTPLYLSFASEDSHKSTSHRAARNMKCHQKSLEKNHYKIKKGTIWAAKGSQKAPSGSPKAPSGSPKAPQRCPSEPKGLPRGSQGCPRGLPRAPQGVPWGPRGSPQVPRPLPGELLGRGLGTYFWGSPKRSTKMRQNRFQDLSVEGEK